jgi:beta-glucosidase
MTHETTPTSAQDTAADVRAREVEEQMTDDERFSVLISVAGSSTVAPTHDARFPEDVPMCTSYTPGVPRLGVPALLMSDSSMGIVNLDFRPGDAATALPASIVLASSFNPELARRWPDDRPGGAQPGLSTSNWRAASSQWRMVWLQFSE